LASIVAAGSLYSCTATKGSDGSITISFAPDMVITAWGLEDALSKLTTLFGACFWGTFDRPCTLEELAQINKAIETVTAKKPHLREASEI
jgi:hypothetical protein